VRVLLDTNVLVAAFIARGTCHDLLEHCERAHQPVTSEFILAEFEAKLTGKFKIPAQRARAAAELVRAHAEVVTARALPAPVCRDPDDDWVLASAVAGACASLVTGDKDLLSLGSYQGIPILSPGAFWSFERESRPRA
jgi:putative PIN family toxin of toxin-antitoxin system